MCLPVSVKRKRFQVSHSRKPARGPSHSLCECVILLFERNVKLWNFSVVISHLMIYSGNRLTHSCCFAVEKPVESMATSKKTGSSSESSGSSTDSEADGTGDLLQI